MFNQNAARKEINKIDKLNGFIMRIQNAKINVSQSYKFEDRKSGRVLIENMTFCSAYKHAECCKTWL